MGALSDRSSSAVFILNADGTLTVAGGSSDSQWGDGWKLPMDVRLNAYEARDFDLARRLYLVRKQEAGQSSSRLAHCRRAHSSREQ
jgi:hypothetical protein